MGTAPDVVVYTQMLCGFCYRAKRLLGDRGVAFREIDVTGSPELRAEMMTAAGGARTAPQIFINGSHVGGSDELAAAAASGELDRLLGDV
ncbi:MAG: glutaredoxin 3 [Rhodospirillales bacterium]|nr:glutaredoxin 3 [Rhodospirillales bacterium]